MGATFTIAPFRHSTDRYSLRCVQNSGFPRLSIAANRSRASISTRWRLDIGPRDTSPEVSSSVCSPFRGMASGPARLRLFLTTAETQSPDGSIKGSAENTMTRDSLRGSTYSTQGSLDDDNGAMVNVAPLERRGTWRVHRIAAQVHFLCDCGQGSADFSTLSVANLHTLE